MQSTKGRGEHIIMLVRVDAQGKRFDIQPFKYIPGDKFKTRKAAFKHAEQARMRWQDNYHQYRDATIILVDSATLEPNIVKPVPAPLAVLRHYVAKGPHIVGQSRNIAPILAPTDRWPEVNHPRD